MFLNVSRVTLINAFKAGESHFSLWYINWALILGSVRKNCCRLKTCRYRFCRNHKATPLNWSGLKFDIYSFKRYRLSHTLYLYIRSPLLPNDYRMIPCFLFCNLDKKGLIPDLKLYSVIILFRN